MNNILEDNGANIYVHNSGYDIRVVTQDKIQAKLGSMGPDTITAALGYGLQNEDSDYIHVLWLFTSDKIYIANGISDGRFIAIGDNPMGEKLGEMRFSHEMIHTLGYITHVFGDPTNLMNDGDFGTKLTLQQLQDIWKSLNQPYDKLLKLSCDK